jgi:hypothetical protein
MHVMMLGRQKSSSLMRRFKNDRFHLIENFCHLDRQLFSEVKAFIGV